jgi:hypothetical protein
VHGIVLRSLLVLVLVSRSGGPVRVAELERAVAAAGFRAGPGRASKAISDALRWEVARGRVVRVARGQYAAGAVAGVTAHRMRRRVEAARRGGWRGGVAA